MTSTLGMPSLTPSNASGRSGVADDQVGHIGKGILGTIEEGVGGSSARSFYYGTGAAFFQAPSIQRSYGDDPRSFNVKTFGSRGMVNLARRWFEQGPTEIYFTYPIHYAWAGPEYHLRTISKTNFPCMANQTQFSTTLGAINQTILTGPYSQDQFIAPLLGDIGTEVRSGPNLLPTYFWSGGVGFAFPSMIELNMGGGGNIIFDRYTNFAMVMASCPTIQMRKDLMRLAGGGLYYDFETDYSTLPVKFGPVPMPTDEGMAYNRNATNTATSENGEMLSTIWAPIEWHMCVPIKTPQTNFWNSLLSRKPIDSSCFASDLQIILALGNFAEFSDTGTGLAHCPYYIPPGGLAVTSAVVASDYVAAIPFYHPNLSFRPVTLNAMANSNFYTTDRWFVTKGVDTTFSATSGSHWVILDNGFRYVTEAAVVEYSSYLTPNQLPAGYFYTGYCPQYFYSNVQLGLGTTSATNIMTTDFNTQLAAIDYTVTPVANNGIRFSKNPKTPRCRVAANPRIWANHYRVCNGSLYGGYAKHRPKFPVPATTGGGSDLRYMKDAVTGNAISYETSFSRMEFRNRSIKLTNPSLSARLPLQSAPGSCVYYPFSYGFQQTYRIPPSSNPYAAAGFNRWCSNEVLQGTRLTQNGQSVLSVLQDVLASGNRISQNIIMPANPVTSMIIGIYREKDRKYLGINTQGTYSPVLFWNALNPVRATLYDGGNILFDYAGPTTHEFGSLVDRPDILKIPFRGGLCQLDPQQVLPTTYESTVNVGGFGVDFPNSMLGGRTFPHRYVRNSANTPTHGSRETPIHLTEWYNCYLLEFPFCLHEPLSREGTVQSTPSFAKTILRYDFFIDALLKPPRGLDDQYDQTTIVPNAWFCGEWDYNYLNFPAGTASLPYNSASTSSWGPLSFASTNNVANCNVALSVPSAYILDSVQNFNSYADERESVVQSTRSTSLANPYYTMSPNASSWNVNDGGLMIQVTFLQNQVWVISPLRTTILATRG